MGPLRVLLLVLVHHRALCFRLEGHNDAAPKVVHGRRMPSGSPNSGCDQSDGGTSCLDEQDCDASCPPSMVTVPMCPLDAGQLLSGMRWHDWDSSNAFSSDMLVMRSMHSDEMPRVTDLPPGTCWGSGTCAEHPGTICGKFHGPASNWHGWHVHLDQGSGSDTKPCRNPVSGDDAVLMAPTFAAACRAICDHLYQAGCRAWMLEDAPEAKCVFFTGFLPATPGGAEREFLMDIAPSPPSGLSGILWPHSTGITPPSWIGCPHQPGEPQKKPELACYTHVRASRFARLLLRGGPRCRAPGSTPSSPWSDDPPPAPAPSPRPLETDHRFILLPRRSGGRSRKRGAPFTT
jgi:hypothetical protein